MNVCRLATLSTLTLMFQEKGGIRVLHMSSMTVLLKKKLHRFIHTCLILELKNDT